MKLKYYLRGLGIGIFVTAIIMGISSGKKQMTDEEVRLRARELGMVESTLLSDMANLSRPEQQEGVPEATEPNEENPKETEPEEGMPEGTEPGEEASKETEPEEGMPEVTEPEEGTPEVTEPGEGTPEVTEPGEGTPEMTEPGEGTPEVTEPEEGTPEVTEPEKDQPVTTDSETVTLTIQSGQSSGTVSRLLAEAGLVESASEYDRYLCANSYDKKIRAGTYQIPVGADEETIARIITRSPAAN